MIRETPCSSKRLTLLALALVAPITFVVIPHKAQATLIGDEVSYEQTTTSFDHSVAHGSGVTTVGTGIEVDPIIAGSPWLALDVTASSFELVYDNVVHRAIRKLEFTLGDLDWGDQNGEIVGATFTINDLNGAAATITTTAHSVSIVLDNTDGNYFVWEIGDRLVVDIQAQHAPHQVGIDIKPGSFPNSINLRSRGATPAAILGSDDLDVNDIDADTLTLATAGVKTVGRPDNPLLCSVEDVSGDFSSGREGWPDGIDDLVCHFTTYQIVPEGGDTEATLSGELNDGTPIEGTDSVRIVH